MILAILRNPQPYSMLSLFIRALYLHLYRYFPLHCSCFPQSFTSANFTGFQRAWLIQSSFTQELICFLFIRLSIPDHTAPCTEQLRWSVFLSIILGGYCVSLLFELKNTLVKVYDNSIQNPANRRALIQRCTGLYMKNCDMQLKGKYTYPEQ